jgi:hypothetical protein
MARRPDPERIAAAREAGIRNWLRDARQVAHVDDLLAAWADEAAARGLTRFDRRYWDEARPWLEEHAR